ncbi:MAG: hypothetical protein V4587_18145 [Acidobacteriota bacterium]
MATGAWLDDVTVKQAIFFSRGANPAGNRAAKQDEDAGPPHDQRQGGLDMLPSFTKDGEKRPGHLATPRIKLGTFLWIDSIIRTGVDFRLKKMNLKLIFCKTLQSLGKTEASACFEI